MKKALFAIALLCVVCGPSRAAELSLVERGHATMDLIDRCLRTDRGWVYHQEVKPYDAKFGPGPAYNWALGIQLSAINAGARLDRGRYRPKLDEIVKLLDLYWIEADGIGGYADSFRPKKADRYYDDNAWVVLALLESYELTRDRSLLDRARKAADYVFSGEDEALGGGLYWREMEKKSKHTCSNAPGIVCALRLHEVTGDARYIPIARRLYAWTNATLQDPSDGLFWDKKSVKGELDKTKWSYNSALMIRANCLLFDHTKDAQYLGEAQRIATSAAARWIKPDGRISDHSYFGHLLAEALLELGARDNDPRWPQLVERTADFVWGPNRDAVGAHPERWDAVPGEKKVEKIQLMPQASAARLFFRLAIFRRDRAGASSPGSKSDG
jgi:hypothetical protein